MPNNTSNRTAEPRPIAGVRFGDDDLGRMYALVTLGDRHALLSPSDLMLPATRLAQKLGERGVLVFDGAAVKDIKAAAKAAGRSLSFRVALLPGWTRKELYLHGAYPIGAVDASLFIDPTMLMLGDRAGKFAIQGTNDNWGRLVRQFAAGQPLLTFLLAAAFASVILSRLEIQPFVLLLSGPSSIGKSAAAVFVGSIFGGDPSRPQHCFVESFKATEAGIEKLGFAHKDAFLLLDEFSRVRGTPAQRAEVLEGFVDDFCAGVGKTRQTDLLGGLQWSGAALITSNESYSRLVADAGQPPAESMGPRLIDLPADAGVGHGIFDSIPKGFSTSLEASNEMRAAAMSAYGHGIREFAKRLIEAEKRDASAVAGLLASSKQAFVRWAGPELTTVHGQLRDKLAAIFATGILAQHLKVLPGELNMKKAVAWAWKAIVGHLETTQACQFASNRGSDANSMTIGRFTPHR